MFSALISSFELQLPVRSNSLFLQLLSIKVLQSFVSFTCLCAGLSSHCFPEIRRISAKLFLICLCCKLLPSCFLAERSSSLQDVLIYFFFLFPDHNVFLLNFLWWSPAQIYLPSNIFFQISCWKNLFLLLLLSSQHDTLHISVRLQICKIVFLLVFLFFFFGQEKKVRESC